MNAKTVEQVYNELNARGLIRFPVNPVAFNVIAQTLSAGEPMSLDEARTLMSAAVPESRLSIELEVNFSSSNPGVDVEFQVWNGQQHFQGPSLKAAVELLLIEEGKFSGSTEEADAILREAMAYQEQNCDSAPD